VLGRSSRRFEQLVVDGHLLDCVLGDAARGRDHDRDGITHHADPVERECSARGRRGQEWEQPDEGVRELRDVRTGEDGDDARHLPRSTDVDAADQCADGARANAAQHVGHH
jgi:hypothetical protein